MGIQVGLVMRETLAERVSRRVRELAERRGFKTALARRLRLSAPAITPYVSGERDVSLDMLEAVAELASVPVAELVAPPGTIHQLNPDEAALIRWLRRWPLSVTRALCAFLAFFADEPSEIAQTRNLHELWRRMPAKKREWFYSVGLLLQEGTLAPDLQARLLRQLEADQSAYAADPEGRRGRGDDA